MWLCWVFVAAPRVFDVHCGRWVLVPWPGINPGPLHWEPEVLATGQPTKEVPPQIFISEIKRPSFSGSIYRGKLPWTCDQRSSGLRLWRGRGKMDREEPGQLAVRVHPQNPSLAPAILEAGARQGWAGEAGAGCEVGDHGGGIGESEGSCCRMGTGRKVVWEGWASTRFPW